MLLLQAPEDLKLPQIADMGLLVLPEFDGLDNRRTLEFEREKLRRTVGVG